MLSSFPKGHQMTGKNDTLETKLWKQVTKAAVTTSTLGHFYWTKTDDMQYFNHVIYSSFTYTGFAFFFSRWPRMDSEVESLLLLCHLCHTSRCNCCVQMWFPSGKDNKRTDVYTIYKSDTQGHRREHVSVRPWRKAVVFTIRSSGSRYRMAVSSTCCGHPSGRKRPRHNRCRQTTTEQTVCWATCFLHAALSTGCSLAPPPPPTTARAWINQYEG